MIHVAPLSYYCKNEIKTSNNIIFWFSVLVAEETKLFLLIWKHDIQVCFITGML